MGDPDKNSQGGGAGRETGGLCGTGQNGEMRQIQRWGGG